MLKVAALCGRDWASTMRSELGIVPETAPPHETATVGLKGFLTQAATADVLALNLHGYLGQAGYAGQTGQVQGPTALTPEDVLAHRWDGVTVFLEVCFSAAEHPANQAMPQAFYRRGARAVIGSTSEAYGRATPARFWPGRDGEADRLLRFFLFWLRQWPNDPARALTWAKRALRVWSFPLDREDRATLESFVLIERSDDEYE